MLGFKTAKVLMGITSMQVRHAMNHHKKEKEYIDADDLKFKVAVLQTLSEQDLDDTEDPSLFWARRKEMNMNKLKK